MYSASESVYTDHNNLMHDKPTKNNNPSSNNGWIYTAYFIRRNFKRAGVFLMDLHLWNAFERCTRDDFYIPRRLPGLTNPPISRDEIIGMYSIYRKRAEQRLGIGARGGRFGASVFRFKDFSFSQVVGELKQAFEHRNDRNFFWKNDLKVMHALAFKLAPWDLHYVRKMGGLKSTLMGWFLFNVYALFTILKPVKGTSQRSEKNLLWLQLHDLKSAFLLKLLPKNAYFESYFPKGHPIAKRA